MKKVDNRFADKVGAEYALFPLAAPHYEECQRLIATVCAETAGESPRILEVGCGTGLTTLALISAMPKANIIALDAEEVMIVQARKVLPQKVELVCADALSYLQSLPKNSFDSVVTAFCLHNTPTDYRLAVFKEMGRVLKTGGSIVSGDKIAQDDILEHWRSLREQVDAFAVFKTTDYPELQAEWTAHYLEDDRIRFSEKEQRQLLKIAGCGSIKLWRRWRMDAVFSAKKR